MGSYGKSFARCGPEHLKDRFSPDETTRDFLL